MKSQPRKRKLRVAEGPYKVTFFIDGKEATKEEVIQHLKEQFARKGCKRLDHQNRNLGRSQDTVRLA